jgi:hypothetical protein
MRALSVVRRLHRQAPCKGILPYEISRTRAQFSVPLRSREIGDAKILGKGVGRGCDFPVQFLHFYLNDIITNFIAVLFRICIDSFDNYKFLYS